MSGKERMGRLLSALEKYKYVALVALVGVLLLVWPAPDSRETADAQAQPRADPFATEELEGRLERALSQVEGAGQVTVLLTLDASPRQVLAQEGRSVVGEDRTERETEVILAAKGSGTQEPVELQQLGPSYRGALVVAAGGDDPAVRLSLIQAVSALTGLGSDKISICKGK